MSTIGMKQWYLLLHGCMLASRYLLLVLVCNVGGCQEKRKKNKKCLCDLLLLRYCFDLSSFLAVCRGM